MRFFDYFRLGIKNLARQKSRTALTIIAITVGSLSLILMASLIISIRQSLVDQFKNLGAFNLVTVVKDPNSVDNNNLMGTGGDTSEGKMMTDSTLLDMKKLGHVIAATPTLGVNINTMRLAGQDKKTWANLTAYDPSSDVFSIPLVAGRKLASTDMDKIVVGARFLDDFKQRGHEQELIGKKVILNTKMGGGPYQTIDWGPLPEKPPQNVDWGKDQGNNNKGIDIEAEIVGVSDQGAVSDGSYINIAWARRLNTQVSWQNDDQTQKECQQRQQQAQQQAQEAAKQSGQQYYGGGDQCQANLVLTKQDNFKNQGYSSIILRVDDTGNIQSVADQITKIGYGAVTAQAMLDQINKIMTMIGVVLGIIAGISLFVAGIGIINTMVMATYERIREIGVMRACGATRAMIRRLFTFEAAMLGFWGGVFGMAVSLILGQVAKLVIGKFGASLGNIPVDHIGSFPWWLVAGVVAFTTLIGLFSGLGPAIKAARLNPVDALRYE